MLQKEMDYILSFNTEGRLVITMLSEQAEALTSVTVESVSIDPSKVTAADIIGGYDVKTGKESGFEAVRQGWCLRFYSRPDGATCRRSEQ